MYGREGRLASIGRSIHTEYLAHHPMVRSLGIRSVVIVMALVASIVAADVQLVRATSPTVSQGTSSSTVAPGSTVDLTAGVPVAGAGSLTQEIVQQIDPTKVRLTSLADIQYPTGWTLSYCTNSTCSSVSDFSTSVPTNWATVRAVKATGSIQSEGADSNGYQVAAATTTGTASSLTPGNIPTSGVGDGYEAFFDPDRTRVFNVYHHSGNNALVTDRLIDCHVIATGGTCNGFPFAANLPTGKKVTGRIVGTKLWFTTGSPYTVSGSDFSGQPGFGCIDLSAVLASGGVPTMCSTSFVRLSTSSQLLETFWHIGNEAFPGQTTVGVPTETRLWAMASNKLVCLDTAAMAACAGMPANGWTLPRPIDSTTQYHSIDVINGKVFYAGKGTTVAKSMVGCVLVSSPTTECPGWGATQVSTVTAAFGGELLTLPDASGAVAGVCGISSAPWIACWTLAGGPLTAPTSIPTGLAGGPRPITLGSRVYQSNGVFWCWDASLNGGAGGVCTSTFGNSVYTAVPDPAIVGCLWSSKDIATAPLNVNLQSWNTTVVPSTSGCGSLAPVRAAFKGSGVVPRMGCATSGTAIRAWQSFTLTSPAPSANFSAVLTVADASGRTVAGWSRVPLTAGSALDLSSLSPSVTGLTPQFLVDFTVTSGSVASATGKVQLIGDAPQLCLHATAVLVCGSGTIGPFDPLALASGSASVTASGSVDPGGSLGTDSATITVSAPTPAQCGGSLVGRAGTATLGTTGDAVVGLTVILLDSSGNFVTSNGAPVTTTTDASGNYSFPYLLPADYRVRFPEAGTTSASAGAVFSSVTVATGGTGTVSASTGCATSWTFDASTSTCVRTVTSTLGDVGAPSGSTLSYVVVGGGGGGAAYNAAGSRGGDGGQVQTGTVTTTGTVGVTIGAGGAAGAAGGTTSMTGGASVSATGGAGGGAANPADAGTTSSLSGTPIAYGADGVNWSGVANTSAGGAGTANRGNGGGAGWRRYEGAGCYEPGANHVYVNPGGPCGVGGTYENGGWAAIQPAGAGGSGVVVLRYPMRPASNAATVPLGGQAVVDALYFANPIARANTSTGAQDAVQTIAVVADDTASTGATYTGGSTALKLCSSGQVSPNCTATSVVISGQGSYAVSGTSITFTPCTGTNTPVMSPACTGRFTGTATAATYQSTDSLGRTASATATPTVVALPTATADAQTSAWDVTQTYTPQSNDSAGAGGSMATSPAGICLGSVTVAASCTTAGNSITIAGQGTYTLDPATGRVTFDPLPTWSGVATSIKYAAVDSLGQKVLSTITPTVLAPPPPTANPDTSSGVIGAAQSVTPFTNDTATTGITFTATSVKLCSTGQTAPSCTATTVVVSGKGSYSVNSTTGVITFTPCSGAGTPVMSPACTAAFVGVATPVTYQVGTNLSQTASSTYTPTVVPLPTATADTQTAPWDVTQSYSPTANDTAGTGASVVAVPAGICLSSVTVASSCTTVGNSITIAGQGTYVLDATTGVVTFDPLPSFKGTATPIKYALVDSLGQKVLSTISPVVTAPPSPVATPMSRTVTPGGSVAFTTLTGGGGLSSTGGPAFDTASTCLVDASVMPNTCGTSVTIAGEGTYVLDRTTGVVTYTADIGSVAGTKTPVTYRVSDATGLTATSTLTPIVPPPPTAGSDSSIDEQNVAQVVPVLSNDEGTATTSLDPSTVRLCPSNATAPFTGTNCSLTTLDVADVGRYTVGGDGTVTFEPCTSVVGVTCAGTYMGSAVFTGMASPVRYVVADSIGQYASSTLTVEVLPPPVVHPVDDAGTSPFGEPVVFDPLANDSGGSPTGLTGYTTVGTSTIDDTTITLCGPGESVPNCTASSVSTPAGDYVLDPATHEITFTPASNYVGTPSSSPLYSVCNRIDGSWSPVQPQVTCKGARLTPTILAPDVPVAVDDLADGPYDTPLVIHVLTNDSNDAATTVSPSSVKLCATGQTPPNCTALTVEVVGEGTYAVDPATGDVTFTPSSSFAGTASVHPVYQFTDSFGQTVSASITPTIEPPPAPTATAESELVLAGSTVTFTATIGVSGLASGTGLRTGSVDGPCLVDPADSVCKESFTIPGAGDWTIDRVTGVASFTADPAATVGNQTAVLYVVTDIVGQHASALLTPEIPAAPILVSDVDSDRLDVDQTFTVLANDLAATGTHFDADSLALCDIGQSSPHCDATTVVVLGEGTFTLDPATGIVTFDPLPTFFGAASSLVYQVTDSMGRVGSSAITPTVVVDLPTASPDTSSGAYRATQTRDLLLNDTSDPAVDLDASSVRLCDPTTTPAETPNSCTVGAGVTISVPDVGDFSVDANGIVTFIPVASFTGTAPALHYQVRDTLGQYASSTYTPSVVAPVAPSAVADTTIGAQGAVQTGDILANDGTTVDGQVLLSSSVRLCSAAEVAPNCSETTIIAPGQGEYVVDLATGSIRFTPCSASGVPASASCIAAFTGVADGVTYVATTNTSQSTSSTYVPTVVPPPSSSPDGSQGAKGRTQTITLLSNDSAGDSLAPLDPSTLRLCGPADIAPDCQQTRVEVPGVGVFEITGSGTVAFTPDPEFVGTSPSITYAVTDSVGQRTSSTLEVVVVPPPAPLTVDDGATGPMDTAMVIDVLANDDAGEVPAGQTGVVELVRSSLRLCGPTQTPPNCTSTTLVTADGTYTVDTRTGFVTFMPRTGFVGRVTQPVTYQVTNDWSGLSGPGTSSAVITPVIDPVAPPVEPPTTTSTTTTVPSSTTSSTVPSSVPVDLTDPGGPGTESNDPLTALPRTGSDSFGIALWGAVLVVAGGLLVGLQRRGRRS